MHELIDFLSQPLAMELTAAQSFVSSLRSLEREPLIARESYCLDETLSERCGIDAVDQMSSRGGSLIAVVPLFGPLSMHGGRFSTSTNAFANTARKLDANESISTIVYLVDSPGGTVTGTMEAANTIRAIRDAGRTKTIAMIEPMMASAATWISTAAGEVVATPSGEAGSVGVISMYEDWSAALENMGIKIDIARTPGRKARFSGVEPMSEEMRQTMELRNLAAYDQFITAMAANRGIPKSQVERRFGSGEMMSAVEAREAGLIDRIATLDEVLAGIGRPGRAKGRKAEDETPQPTAEAAAELAKVDRRKRLEAIEA